MKKIQRIPDAELDVMQAVWSADKHISTSEIRKILERERAWSVGALQTLLSRLVQRGFLEARMQGKSKIFSPLVSEEDYLAAVSKSFVSKLSRNSVTRLVSALYESNSISEEDLEELNRFIESKISENH